MKHSSDALLVEVTPDILEEAKERNKKFFNSFGNSGTHRMDKDNQRITGYLAEAAINHSIPTLTYSNNNAYDFINPIGKTFESKAQSGNGKPYPYFAATTYPEQELPCDFLIFSRVLNNLSKVYICGFISIPDYKRIRQYIEANTPNNNFMYKEARWQITLDQLKNIRLLMPIGDN